MVDVLITNIKLESIATEMLHFLEGAHPQLKFNFDLEDFDKPYPCDHSILRIEGSFIDTNVIKEQLKNKGFRCGLLEDKICV